jgi:hypothetical protein
MRRVVEDARMDLNAVLAKLNDAVATHTEARVFHLPPS